MGALDKFVGTKTSSKSSSGKSSSIGATSGSGISKFIKPASQSTDQNAFLEGVATQAGLGEEAKQILDTTPKLSFLQRLVAGLGAFETGNAVYKGVSSKSATEGVKQYGKDIYGGLKSAFTGKDVGQSEKKHYQDVLPQFNPEEAGGLGKANRVGNFITGLAGDIFLDPSTYFGGSAVKYTAKGVKALVPKAVKEAVVPVTEAFGKAFKFGSGTSKGLPEKTLETVGDLSKTKEGIVESNVRRLVEPTTKAERTLISDKLLAGKRAEYELSQHIEQTAAKGLQEIAPGLKVTRENASRLLDVVENDTVKRISAIRKSIDDIVRPLFKERQVAIRGGRTLTSEVSGLVAPGGRKSLSRVDDLNRVVDGLRQQLKAFKNIRTSPPKLGPGAVAPVTKQEIIDVSNKLISYEEERLAKLIDNLSEKLSKAKSGAPTVTKSGLKLPPASIQDTIIYGERQIMEYQKELLQKQRLLNVIADSRNIAKSTIADAMRSGDFSRVPQHIADLFQFATQTSDPKIAKIISDQIARSKKFAATAGIKNPYEIYFPSLTNDKLKTFDESLRRFGVGSEGYKKEFRDLLKDSDLIKNPAEAFARREYQVLQDFKIRKFLNESIQDFGKPLDAFKNADEARRAGFELVKDKGTFGKELGYLPSADKEFIDSFFFPGKLARTIDNLARATGFDAVTNLFKRSVTGLFLPFHVRNWVSGMIQNYEVLGARALAPRNIVDGQKIAWTLSKGEEGKGLIKIRGRDLKLKEVIKPFEKRFGTSSQYISDFADATSGHISLPSKLSKFNPLSANNPAFRAARAVGNFIETQQKATAYLTALRKGENIEGALQAAARAGFDYRALTSFESKILRRIIPFYSFTRKNIELQLRTLGESPERINNVLKVFDRMQSDLTAEEKQKLPDYLKESFAFKTGEARPGIPEISAGFGTPIEQVFSVAGPEPLRRIAATMNPIFKLPLERTFGVEFFRDRPLDEVVQANEYKKAPQWVKDFLKAKEATKVDKEGNKYTVLNADPEKLQLLRSLPTSRGVSYLAAIFSDDTTDTTKILQSTTGLKPRPIDLETVEYFRNRNKQKELENLLIRAGVLKRFEKTYVPKDNP